MIKLLLRFKTTDENNPVYKVFQEQLITEHRQNYWVNRVKKMLANDRLPETPQSSIT